MRTVIIGAGNAGRQLARHLCEERHSVVMVDADPQALKLAETGLDILTVCGEGSNPAVLEEAHTEKADLFIAVTDNDEVNILSCLFGHAVGVKSKIARVTNPAFINGSSRYDLQKMGIDLVINQKCECAREVFNMLQIPGALEVFDLFSGKMMVAGFNVNTASPLFDRTPAECDRLDLIQQIRVIAVHRSGELLVPHGNTRFQQKDRVYLVGQREDISNFFKWVMPDIEPFEKVIIAGGGDLGLMLAKFIEQEIDTVLLEQDEQRARFCSAELDKTLVLRVDALTETALEESGLNRHTAFIALTGDDEGNIMNCLMAQKKGAAFTATQITRTDFIPVVEQLYLVNRVVSPYLSTANAILHWLRSKKVRAASLLHNLPGELLDVVIAENHKINGMRIKEIRMPKTAIVAAILRNGEAATATGSLQLQTGDHALIFCHPDTVEKIRSLFL